MKYTCIDIIQWALSRPLTKGHPSYLATFLVHFEYLIRGGPLYCEAMPDMRGCIRQVFNTGFTVLTQVFVVKKLRFIPNQDSIPDLTNVFCCLVFCILWGRQPD